MTVFIGRDGRHLNCDDARRIVHDEREPDDDVEREEFGADWSDEERAVARDAVELHRRAEDRRRARDKRGGKDASEELPPIEREFATTDRKARDGANANIGTAPSGSKTGDRARARGRDVNHIRDFEPTTADSRHGYSRNGSVNIDDIWSPSGTA